MGSARSCLNELAAVTRDPARSTAPDFGGRRASPSYFRGSCQDSFRHRGLVPAGPAVARSRHAPTRSTSDEGSSLLAIAPSGCSPSPSRDGGPVACGGGCSSRSLAELRPGLIHLPRSCSGGLPSACPPRAGSPAAGASRQGPTPDTPAGDTISATGRTSVCAPSPGALVTIASDAVPSEVIGTGASAGRSAGGVLSWISLPAICGPRRGAGAAGCSVRSLT
jgi:hypothetical protein